MRWIWTLVIACLVAAGGVCPEQELQRGPAGAKLSREHAALAVIGTRRDHSPRPDLGFSIAVTQHRLELGAPRSYVLVSLRSAHSAPVAVPVTTRSSRGPPVG